MLSYIWENLCTSEISNQKERKGEWNIVEWSMLDDREDQERKIKGGTSNNSE